MIRYLCISATFLDPSFHGKDDEGPEWPPSPMRLFQALLAGARTGCRGNEWSVTKAEAFRWLEKQEPPVIVCPHVHASSGHTFFVPDNISDKVLDRGGRLISKTARPCHMRDGDTVHYLWPIHDGTLLIDQQAEGLGEEARHLLALGWGVDQVVGDGRILTADEAAGLPGGRWQPWNGHRPGAPTWRVPIEGTLADLERVHQLFLKRMEAKQYLHHVRKFAGICYLPHNTLPPRSYAAFELPEGVAFRQESAAKVAAMLRSLTSRHAKTDTHPFLGGTEAYVAGHAGKQEQTPPRFSYLPLPTIGHSHADGMLRRLLVAEPFGGDGTHARWAQSRLLNGVLTDQDGNERGVLMDLWRPTSTRIVARYISDARTWSTVTPVILPGHDDGKHAKAEKLFLAALRQAGLPVEAVSELAMRKAPFWPGSQHPRQYFVPDYLRGSPGWHVRLALREQISGPLAIGAGRHLGLGLFAAEE